MQNSQRITAVLSEIDSEVKEKGKHLDDTTLEGGKSGLALYNFFCHKFYKQEIYKDRAEEQIEQCIEMLSEISASESFTSKFKTDSLSNHIASFGKTLLFAQYRFRYEYDFGEIYNNMSEILFDLNASSFKNKDFDINSGALSAGYFFLNRYFYEKDEFSKHALLHIAAAIDKSAIFNTEDEVYWRSPTLSNQVYLGLSHGSSMIINFITKLFELGVLNQANDDLLKLLENATRFVINRKRNYINGYFPAFYPDEGLKETQFTMCYGDLGVLYSLYNASVVLKRDSFRQDVLDMLLTCAKRKKDINYTYDGGIVYGASGVACIFKELYKRTIDARFKTAYEYWYNEILCYRNPDQKEFAGFNNRFEKIKPDDKVFNLTFGWGIMGIGICLMLGIDADLPPVNELMIIGI